MKKHYYINRNEQPEGEHEIHDSHANCPHPPLSVNRIDLGWFDSCVEAVKEGRTLFPYSQVNGCAYCVPACNTD